MFALTGCGGTGKYIPVLSPQGPVARSEYYLIIWSFALMMIVVLGVFIIFFYMLYKYRARPENKDYVPPEIEGNARWESIWTIIPIIIVIALAIPTVAVTYNLVKPPKVDAASAGTTKSEPITIDVISERWKWVFKYPAQNLETVNYVVIPAGQPVDFELSSTGPMNAFWVPALGGMEFNMPGKDLKLWLEADKPGTYDGRSAQYSGVGFTNMTFQVLSKSPTDFTNWVQQTKQSAPPLTKQAQAQLAKPGSVSKMQFSSMNPQ
jgi:cytochrome aa3-600 menaquinol oxidase subunit 2